MEQLSFISPDGSFYKFSGSEYSDKHDRKRLTGQLNRIMGFISDHDWHTLREIAVECNAPEASVSAQLRNLRKESFGRHVIEKRARGSRENGIFEYRMII